MYLKNMGPLVLLCMPTDWTKPQNAPMAVYEGGNRQGRPFPQGAADFPQCHQWVPEKVERASTYSCIEEGGLKGQFLHFGPGQLHISDLVSFGAEEALPEHTHRSVNPVYRNRG